MKEFSFLGKGYKFTARKDAGKNLKRKKMKASEKKNLLKHIKKDSQEFRDQLKEDVKLKKQILKSKTEKKRK